MRARLRLNTARHTPTASATSSTFTYGHTVERRPDHGPNPTNGCHPCASYGNTSTRNSSGKEKVPVRTVMSAGRCSTLNRLTQWPSRSAQYDDDRREE
eukprot:gene11209-biopygen8137